MKLAEVISSLINGVNYVQNLEPRMRAVVRKEVNNARRVMLKTTLQLFFFVFAMMMVFAGLIIYVHRYLALDYTLLLFGIIFSLLGVIAGLLLKKRR